MSPSVQNGLHRDAPPRRRDPFGDIDSGRLRRSAGSHSHKLIEVLLHIPLERLVDTNVQHLQ